MNPLTSTAQFNLSDEDMARKRGITPQHEEFKGDNNAYRGIEDHGVTADNRWSEPDAITNEGEEREVTYYEGPPAPVRVQQTPTDIFYQAGNIQLPAGGSRLILPRDPNRRRTLLQEVTLTGSVFLTSGQVNAAIGMPVPRPTMQPSGLPVLATIAQPAAGAQASVTVPANQYWKLKSVYFTVVTSAVVGNRAVGLSVSLGGQLYNWIRSATAQAASSTFFYSFGQDTQQAGATVIDLPLVDFTLLPGTVLSTTVTAIDPADQVSLVAYTYETITPAALPPLEICTTEEVWAYNADTANAAYVAFWNEHYGTQDAAYNG